MRPLKITAPIESDSEISFRDMVNRKNRTLDRSTFGICRHKVLGYTESDIAHGIVR